MSLYDDMNDETLLRMITDEEIELLAQLKLENTEEPYDEEELAAIVSWIAMTRFEMALCDMALDGYILARWNMETEEPVFQSTKLGKTLLRGMDRSQVDNLLDDIFGGSEDE